MLLNVASHAASSGGWLNWRSGRTLVSERASLSTQAAALGSTPRIVEQAQKLGMQPAARVSYVVLPGGDAALGTAPVGTEGEATQAQR